MVFFMGSALVCANSGFAWVEPRWDLFEWASPNPLKSPGPSVAHANPALDILLPRVLYNKCWCGSKTTIIICSLPTVGLPEWSPDGIYLNGLARTHWNPLDPVWPMQILRGISLGSLSGQINQVSLCHMTSLMEEVPQFCNVRKKNEISWEDRRFDETYILLKIFGGPLTT